MYSFYEDEFVFWTLYSVITRNQHTHSDTPEFERWTLYLHFKIGLRTPIYYKLLTGQTTLKNI